MVWGGGGGGGAGWDGEVAVLANCIIPWKPQCCSVTSIVSIHSVCMQANTFFFISWAVQNSIQLCIYTYPLNSGGIISQREMPRPSALSICSALGRGGERRKEERKEKDDGIEGDQQRGGHR